VSLPEADSWWWLCNVTVQQPGARHEGAKEEKYIEKKRNHSAIKK